GGPLPDIGDLVQGRIPSKDSKTLDAYEEAISAFLIRLYSDIKDVRYEREISDDHIEYRLNVVKEIEGMERTIPFSRESSGTRKLLDVFQPLLACSIGGVAFIDELDSGIHDKLVVDVMSQIMPKIRGQLVITTHNTSLMEITKPSSLFILRVDRNGYKDIRPMNRIAEVQTNNNKRKIYLKGAFDGIPHIRDLDLEGIADDLIRDAGSS
ncbi:MAG: ATP/GTP-binding protein, partial [Candidatus Methanomethylophilaceae archaeon]